MPSSDKIKDFFLLESIRVFVVIISIFMLAYFL